jgi:hypothetical protein
MGGRAADGGRLPALARRLCGQCGAIVSELWGVRFASSQKDLHTPPCSSVSEGSTTKRSSTSVLVLVAPLVLTLLHVVGSFFMSCRGCIDDMIRLYHLSLENG